MASLKGYRDLAALLIARGADVDELTSTHRSALFAACISEQIGSLPFSVRREISQLTLVPLDIASMILAKSTKTINVKETAEGTFIGDGLFHYPR
jgi:hypothetical protein